MACLPVHKFTFSRKERLKKSGQFTRILRGGRRIRGRFLSVAYSTASQPVSRVGITVPKRILRKAHERNKMKRWVREIWRLEKGRIKQPVEVVIQMREKPEKLNYHIVREEALSLLEKAGIL